MFRNHPRLNHPYHKMLRYVKERFYDYLVIILQFPFPCLMPNLLDTSLKLILFNFSPFIVSILIVLDILFSLFSTVLVIKRTIDRVIDGEVKSTSEYHE